MLDFEEARKDLEEYTRNIFRLIKEDNYNYMRQKDKEKYERIMAQDKIINIKYGESVYDSKVFASTNRNGKIFFYPEVRKFQSQDEFTQYAKKIIPHESHHRFIDIYDFSHSDDSEYMMVKRFFVEGLTEKMTRKFIKKHPEISFKKAGYPYEMMFIDSVLSNFNLTLEEFIFSEEQLIKNPMEYKDEIKTFIEKRDEDYKTLLEEVKDLPRDIAQRVVRNGRNIIFYDADLEKAIDTVRQERKKLEEQIEDNQDYNR